MAPQPLWAILFILTWSISVHSRSCTGQPKDRANFIPSRNCNGVTVRNNADGTWQKCVCYCRNATNNRGAAGFYCDPQRMFSTTTIKATTTTMATTTMATTTMATTTMATTTTSGPYVPIFPSSCHNIPIQAEPKSNRTKRRTTCTTKSSKYSPKQAMADPDLKWPDKTVPYTISSAFTACQHDLILEAMREISMKTGCIKFIERTDQVNYVGIVNTNPGCYSEVGHSSDGGQVLNLEDNGCFLNHELQFSTVTPAHELIHALGFTHEHERTDRNDFVEIHPDNVKPGFEQGFGITEGQYLIGPYDYGSIMHYDMYAFSISDNNDKPTITALQEKVVFGQALSLSDLDVQKLKTYYQC